MIRPHEAAGLTAALTRSIDLRAQDLEALLKDDVYRAELGRRGLLTQMRLARGYLSDAQRALGGIANALADPVEHVQVKTGGAS